MAREFTGKPFLRDTRTMAEEPLSLSNSRISSRGSQSPHFVLIDPEMLFQRGDSKAADDTAKFPGQPRQWTQGDQDETDAEEKRRVLKDLIHSWMDRLQLISVITTFFAATEAQLLGFAVPDKEEDTTRIQEAATAVLVGALVIHLCAAIISFLAAFFLIRYRLREAKREEEKVELGTTPKSSPSSEVHIWSTNPHLEQVGPFRRGPPTHLLEHCHSLCMWLAAIGFLLALAGVLCYAWARLSRSACIFATIVMGVCWVTGIGVVFLLP